LITQIKIDYTDNH